MLVYVIRHALAYGRDRERWPDDDLRPLTPVGRRRFRAAAVGLSRLVGPVDLLLTSPLARARQTAEILAEVAGWPRAIETAELAPGVAPKRTLAALRDRTAEQPGRRGRSAQGRELERIALVGHEPHLTHLIAAGTAGSRVEVRSVLEKGGAACLRFDRAARPGRGELVWLLTPEMLCALGEPARNARRQPGGPRGRTHRRR